ncbi:ribosomal protein L5 eukaryotic/L18 archaeal [Kipferlia bialata]|uniref:Ribosomal protein L5 eukaryotic/L18 archaeal n=1 Tax=Kipferlia bialata TaxID=797122 RepID=A0A391NK08_9EUKA|nr:ribosomal protein L5 eukaryotic/L18 archaeal [Kipferlia bialata]|eukprot:g2326.t1
MAFVKVAGAFVKVQKNKAYFKRYQTKFRRRREGRTDYYARKRLVTQAKNKYNMPKYRLVVRRTNKDVIAQIIFSTLDHDEVFCAAYAHELPSYGLSVGLTNYASCYCTGLLLARRVLAKLAEQTGKPLNELYPGVEEVTGEYFKVEEAEDAPAPFTCFLDIGLARATRGARVFSVMKGAIDGGLSIPHSMKRFPGYDDEEKEFSAPEALRDRLFGQHVAESMQYLQENDKEAYEKRFSQYIKAGIAPEDLEALYESVHASIRENPNRAKPEKKNSQGGNKRRAKNSLAHRQARLEQKRASLAYRLAQ